MPCQDSAHVLVRASQRRRAGLPSAAPLTAQLGHRVETRLEQHAGGWLTPIYLHWEETYQTQWIDFDRPRQGAATVEVTCPNCGSAIQVRVRSRGLVLRYYLLVALAVMLTGLACWLVCQDLSFAFGGAVAALSLVTGREVLGDSHHHAALEIVRQSRAGHWLFGPEAAA